ncbi:MAG: hypothetical protein LBU27_02940 [Candidatus Peribacteria bacterium]|nr:hypothetical protein [Candidatus Peribacteria bacterium]
MIVDFITSDIKIVNKEQTSKSMIEPPEHDEEARTTRCNTLLEILWIILFTNQTTTTNLHKKLSLNPLSLLDECQLM